jgi:cyclohexanone monooxygenase
MSSGSTRQLDVVIVGAGFSGLYMLHRLRQLGLKLRVYEAGGGVGGTWYWNRYPGAGSDIESLEYSYGFSEELQQDWKWSKRYAPQPEIEAYLNHVADRFDLRRDIELETRIETTRWDEERQRWVLQTSRGETVIAQFCVMATGLLSEPKKIDIPGAEDFAGQTLHTYNWPKDKVDFRGKRVGVIGTGSSAVQAIPLIAAEAKHLTVFQRTPHFSVPLQNGPLDPEYERRVKSDYKGWRKKQMDSFGGYVSVNFQAQSPPEKLAMESSEAERRAEYEYRWASGGLSFYTSFRDLLLSREANDGLAEFARAKIRARVKDPNVAAKLVPQGYPILTKRLCADTNYYETFNRDNVSLVDVRETPITRVTPRGVLVGDELHELDVLIFATGFDAITGALVNMDVRGRGGRTIKDEWSGGPRTNCGLMADGFPNLFLINGTGSCTGFFNPVLNVEYQGNWFAGMLEHMRAHGHTTVETTREAVDRWTDHMREVAAPTLFWQSENWYIGANVEGKPRAMMLYLGGFGAYRQHCNDVAAKGYEGYRFSGRAAAPIQGAATR